MRHFVIATAGHVDHGKSALVKALTGIDPDRLPEEKARAITIELGFAPFDLELSGGENARVGIVDVPGHQDFVRNMIAGIGSVDLAVFVIAADDGWMPQTEEHLQILSYLGVSRGVIAITKSDLGNGDKVSAQVRDQLQGTVFSNSLLVCTSVHAGSGVPELKRALRLELSRVGPHTDIGKPRLFVDRAFTLPGIGTVATGTLSGGTLHRGQSVFIQPANFEGRIRSVQSHGEDVQVAHPGMRTAINLPDVATGESARAIKRGDIVIAANSSPSSVIDVVLHRSPRMPRGAPPSRPLASGAAVDIHHGTARIAANVVFLEQDELRPGEEAIARLRLETPLFAFLGDRFVIRDRSQQYTIAGGTVLDPDADRHRFRGEGQRKLLRARRRHSTDINLCVISEIERAGAVHVSTLLTKSHFSAEQISAAAERLAKQNQIVIRGDIAAAGATWEAWQARARSLIDRAHIEHPEDTGLDLNKLRAAMSEQNNEAFEAILSDLCAHDFVRSGNVMARKSHRPALSAKLELVATKILNALSEKPFDPPARQQIAGDRAAQQTLNFLIERGSVAEISTDVVLLRESVDRMSSAITNFIARRGPATVSEIRQELQTSRRIIVPLLEHLDRRGVTRRVGDQRALAGTAASKV